MEKKINGMTFRAMLLKSLLISRKDIEKNVKVSRATISIELQGRGNTNPKYRNKIYKYYASVDKTPVSFDDFWCVDVEVKAFNFK